MQNGKYLLLFEFKVRMKPSLHVRRSDLEKLGNLHRENWMEATNLKTDDDILILKLNIEATSYDFLHKRTLEVTFPSRFNSHIYLICKLCHCHDTYYLCY